MIPISKNVAEISAARLRTVLIISSAARRSTCPSMGLRTRVRLDDDGLALGEPALVTILAKARVPRHTPSTLSSRPLTT
jgi:hypothetical protein